jgi:hypothetical protein
MVPMTLVLWIVVIVLAIRSAYVADNRRIAANTWLIAGMSLIAVGHVLNHSRSDVKLGTAAVLIATVTGLRAAAKRRSKLPDARSDVKPSGSIVAVLLIVSLGVFLHFYLGGVPAFSDDVETSRFDLGGSGAFGFPSRTYLFAAPIAAIVVTSRFRVGLVPRSTVIAGWSIFLISRLLGGFKSGLLEVIGTAVICAPIIWPQKINFSARLRTGAFIAIAILTSWMLASRYQTLDASSAGDFSAYVADRVTIGSAVAGNIAHDSFLFPSSSGIYLLDEVEYFVVTYSGGTSSLYPLDVVVAAAQFGEDPTSRSFSAPVTLGLGAGLAVDFGWFFTALAALGLGLLYGRSNQLLLRGGRHDIVSAAALIAINLLLKNGALVYLVINIGVVAVGLILVDRLAAFGWPHRVRSANLQIERQNEL